MYLLPGNPFSHAVEAYRVSGEARCPNYPQHLPPPFTKESNSYSTLDLVLSSSTHTNAVRTVAMAFKESRFSYQSPYQRPSESRLVA